MASHTSNVPHFALFPFAASGHMIPLINTGIMLARRGVKISIFTTALNAARLESLLKPAKESGLPIETILHAFPGQEAGLPEGCESLDMTNTVAEVYQFMNASNMSQDIVEKLFQELLPVPNCIISDLCLPYAAKIANKFGIPRITFHVLGCFSLYCMDRAWTSGIFEDPTINTMEVPLPGLEGKIELNKSQMPFGNPKKPAIKWEMVEADLASYGVLVNSFEGLELDFLKDYKKGRKCKVWCIGPVAVGGKVDSKASADGQECMKWLDSKETSSVLYVCFGSLCNLSTEQMIEMGLGLEASNRPFIWVISQRATFQDLLKWTSESGFEERVKGRGLIIKGWAPQVDILSHHATGGFLTHCGWNSVLEAVSAGVPMICFPLLGDQFCDEILLVEILKIGVSLGVKDPSNLGVGPGSQKMVKKEDFKKAIDELFEGEESGKRREHAGELQNLANRATEEDGSSDIDIKLFIHDIMQLNL